MIKQITTKDFRGESRAYEFGPGVNVLRGPNESRKTTAKHAIAFCLFGVDAEGMKNPEHLISIGQDTSEVALQTDKATFIRKKKRGGQSTLKLSREGVPTATLNQTDLNQALGMGFDTFASSYDVGYFMRLPKERKLEVMSAVAQLDRQRLFSELMSQNLSGINLQEYPRTVKLEKPRIEAGYVADDRRKLQNQLAADKASAARIKEELDRISADLPRRADVDSEEQINSLKARIQLFELYERDLQQYETEFRRHRVLLDKQKEEDGRLEKLQLELTALGAEPVFDETDYNKNLKYLCELRADLQGKHKPRPAEPLKRELLGSGATCTRCGTLVSEKLASQMAAEQEQIIVAYNKEARAVEDHNNDLSAKIRNLEDEAVKLQNFAAKVRAEQHKWQQASVRIKAELSKGAAVAPAEPKSPKCPEGYSPALPKSLKQNLETSVAERGKREYLLKQQPELLKKAKALEEAVSMTEHRIVVHTAFEKALLALPEYEVQKTLELFQIQNHRVVLEEGDLMIYDQNGCPYPSLSDGKKMKVGFELCQLIQQKLKKPPGFYFVDNRDLIDRLPVPQGAQVFMAEVDPNATELSVVQL